MNDPLFDMLFNSRMDSEWAKHAMADPELAKLYMEKFGSYDRRAADAKGFHGGADIAMRYPGKETWLKTLAALYQLQSLIQAGLFDRKNFSPKKEYQDFLANKAGIDAARNLPKNVPYEELLQQAAIRYADPFGDTLK